MSPEPSGLLERVSVSALDWKPTGTTQRNCTPTPHRLKHVYGLDEKSLHLLGYWDNSNIFIGAQQVAIETEGVEARRRVRVEFSNLLELARAGRQVEHAVAVGSIPPELRQVWSRMESEGVAVKLLERGAIQGGEQCVDQTLQTAMLRDAFDYNGNPGIAVLLTGDGAGFADGVGFHADLERMHRRGWRIEVLSWRHSCNRRMREWAEQTGNRKFVTLDDFYESITFLELPAPGQPMAPPRDAVPVNLTNRP